MNVTVMNRTTPIFEVELDESGRLLDVGKIINETLMPVSLQGTGRFTKETVSKWITSRLVPENRIGLEEARRAFPGTFEKHRNMFSLSDQYWFKWTQKDSWQRGNYFTNAYDTDIGRIFFSPWTVRTENLKRESPDLATNGVLKKRWIRNEDTGVSTLIKMGDRTAHQDPISEVLSSMTLQRLNLIPFVPYELCVDGLTFCCKCENFVTDKTEFVPASQIYYRERRDKANTPYQHLLAMIGKYAPGIRDPKDYLDKLIFCDACIGNTDRHLSNFGFIRSAETGEILDFAPVFDSGSCFFNETGLKKTRLFSEEEKKEAIDRVVKKYERRIRAALRERDLLDFVEDYPMLTTEEKGIISKKISEAYSTVLTAVRNTSGHGEEVREI